MVQARLPSLDTKLEKVTGKVTLWFALNLVLLVGFLTFEFSPILKPRWWEDAYSVAMNLLAGGLVSFFFYWLVVYIPEQRKRRIIKDNLTRMYRSIKKDILYQVLFASIKGGRSDLQADHDTIETLMTTDGFKKAFQGGREADEGFYAFENQMSYDTPEFRRIILNLEMLVRQIEFVLHNYTMEDKELFDFFKRLELMLLSLRRSTPGYDESKPLCSFVYQIFSGWNVIEGYRGYDVIDKMIADI
ncbi:hypothetical protein QN222_08680 [Sinorhizobium sp. 6-70]|uniref:hypothetical protein n=1 Tax=Sinorhizobium sp. 6-70 TaxID=3049088 RepID=UPI0024C2E3D0|nr:hypothetical protein [Sinorhizobium sp. 6-70]MDK1374552.1 hypothetical protein [Sinorhizobium sp. 6-70]MDK1478249.1 hypothetical protein [Sinorhizobium sp. 6-117]